MMRLNANQIIGLFLAAFSLGYIWMAFHIPVFPLPRPVDSDAFPKVLGYFLFGLSVWLFFERPPVADTLEESAEENPVWQGPRWQSPKWQVVITALAVLSYALLLQPLGFVVASIALGFGLTWYYGYRKHRINFMVSASIVLTLYLLLTQVMDVHLPTGILPL